MALLIAVFEQISSSDAPALILSLLITVLEGIATADNPETIMPLIIEVLEQINGSDQEDLLLALLILVAESINASDQPDVLGPLLIPIIEAIGAADSSDLGDRDGDGIFEPVDGSLVEGQFLDESGVFSHAFTDGHVETPPLETSGHVIDRGGLQLLIANIANSGIVAGAVGPAEDDAHLSFCDDPPFEVVLSGGDIGVFTCGSLTVHTVVGEIEIELDDGSILGVPPDTEVLIIQEDDGGFQVESVAGTATLTINGVSVTIEEGEPLVLVANQVNLHIVDQAKSGACDDNQPSCTVALADVEVRVFDRNDAAFQDLWSKNPKGTLYDQVFEADAGIIGLCVTGQNGACSTPVQPKRTYLTIAKYIDEAENLTVYTGLPNSSGGEGSANPTRQLRFMKLVQEDGSVQYSGGSKVVVRGSYLEIIYPDLAVWKHGTQRYRYPFLLTSDSDWTALICAQPSDEYQVSGIHVGSLEVSDGSKCVQTHVSGEPVVVTFDVISQELAIPQMRARLEVLSPHNEMTILDLEIPGILGMESPSQWFATRPAYAGYSVTVITTVFFLAVAALRRKRRNPTGAESLPSYSS